MKMPDENKATGSSSSESGRRLALGYLRHRIREAHIRGDGSTVNHLCAIALEHIRRWQREENSTLSLEDWWWAVAMSCYWLVDQYMLRYCEECLSKVAAEDEGSQELARILNAVVNLIKEPLYEAPSIQEDLWKAEFHWLTGENQTEGLTLLVFAIELLWIHRLSKMDSSWSQLAANWRAKVSGFARLTEALQNAVGRLTVQEKIVWPGISGQDSEEWRDQNDRLEARIYRAWKAWIARDWDAFDLLLKDLVPSTSMESVHAVPLWRLHDMARGVKTHPLNRAYWEARGDPQVLGLTRMRERVLAGGYIAFQEIRDRALKNYLAEVWREGSSENRATERFHCVRLAMLNQIAALRIWDLASWLHTAKLVSEIFLELASQHDREGYFAREAIWWTVLALHLRENDPFLKRAISLLERTDLVYTGTLVQGLILSRAIEYGHAMYVLSELSDAIPENLLPAVAEWWVKCVQFSNHYIHPLQDRHAFFWGGILPYLDDAESICRILYPGIVALYQAKTAWDKNNSAMIESYLLKAPLDLACEIIVSTHGACQGASQEVVANIRSILTSVTRHRSELANKLSQQTGPILEFASNKHADAKCDHNTQAEFLAELKAGYRRTIEITTDAVFCRSENGPFPGIAAIYPNGLNEVSWEQSDSDLVQRLIQVVDHPRATDDEKAQSLLTLAHLLKAGSLSFAEIIFRPFCTWLQSTPTGRDLETRGPLQIFQFHRRGNLIIMSSLADLAREMSRRIPEQVTGPIGAWIEQCGRSAEIRALPSMIRLAITMALHGQASLGYCLLLHAHTMLTKLSCTPGDEETTSALIEVLSELTFMLAPDAGNEGVWGAANEGPRALFLCGLGAWLRTVAGSDDPDVRQAVAYTLREWKRSGTVPEEVSGILEALLGDRRMRVRQAASNDLR